MYNKKKVKTRYDDGNEEDEDDDYHEVLEEEEEEEESEEESYQPTPKIKNQKGNPRSIL